MGCTIIPGPGKPAFCLGVIGKILLKESSGEAPRMGGDPDLLMIFIVWYLIPKKLVRMWRSRSAHDFHRLVLDTRKAGKDGTWTLFIMGPKEKEWGFLSKDEKWVHWKTYIENRNLYT